MPISVALVGYSESAATPHPNTDLLLRCIAAVSGSEVRLCTPSRADLTIMYPYAFPLSSTLGGATLESGVRAALRNPSPEALVGLLRRVYRVRRGSRLLAVSHENLDRRPWQVFGNLIRESSIPRLTFWPAEIDPGGFRFPYWWNYVDWPEIPREEAHLWTRFGRLYNLDSLCSDRALPEDFGVRKPRAVWLTRHLDFPRSGILNELRTRLDVDVVRGVPFGKKWEVLQDYQYCVVTENSPGYGYETEKVPEAVVSGCLAVGYIPNPFSDFNPDAASFLPSRPPLDGLPPLLRQRPSLDPLFAYLSASLGI
jgi:hypothetical protein